MTRSHEIKTIPTKRQRLYSYNDNVDEPAKLIEDEPADVEAEVPIERDESVETGEQEDETAPE
jgi:hypothetical protein